MTETPPSGFAAHLPFQGRLIFFLFVAKIGGHGTTCPYKYTKSCAQLEQPDEATITESFCFCTMVFVEHS